ncbi:MAG: cellulase family glycosylhydrolase [Herpetosiphonaceae bacterium]|nr:cellulase family glycosylhydrolase [Herpetosiphonaceae bacterium]
MKLHILAIPCLLLIFLVPTARLQAAPRCFPEAAPAITACIDGRFQGFWERQGGLAVFGYPLGAAAPDHAQPGAPLTQRFERTWLELHPEHQAPYDVQLSRAGAEVLAQHHQDWTAFPKGDPSTDHFFQETAHAIAPQFWGYWSSHGLEFDGQPGTSLAESVALFGLPLSEPRMEVNSTDGQSYLTQWFERARFEYHPEHAGTPYEVELGLLGRELNSADNGPATQSSSAPATVVLQPGGFIQASGSQLTRLGQAVQVKGVNYYPQGRPWLDMWNAWNGPQVAHELVQARDQLGINAVRVLLPYDTDFASTHDGQISPEQLGRLREMVQIAGSLDLRVIVTLFDFDQIVPARGGREEQQRLHYLRTLLGNFVGDDRIMAWDIHNEPDQYDAWKQGQAPQMLDWLGRIADEVHHDAPNHLVTVGMGYYEDLLRAAPDGRRPIDYSDMVSVHSYNSQDLARELDELRTSTSKPLVLEEFGWPTGITCLNRSYNEAAQAQNYHDALAAASGRMAGVFAWTLRDFDSGPSGRWDTREEHYGLYRADDSLKAAAEPFQAYAARPLPSLFHTHLPLTATGPNPIDGPQAPKLIPGTGHYVKGLFREAWDLFGGAASFGPPITEAFVLPGDVPQHDRVVQYFAAGALELHPEASAMPDFFTLTLPDQIMRQVVPLNIGTTYAAGHVRTEGGHAVADIFNSFYKGAQGSWRLGAPITAALTESLDGTSTPVQYFQNGRLQVNPKTGVIEAGNLGQLVWQAQCNAAQ